MLTYLVNLKHRNPKLWALTEEVNGQLFRLRLSRIERHAERLLTDARVEGYRFALVGDDDVAPISAMLEATPIQYLCNFGPHEFDLATMTRLYRNPSFMMMKVVHEASEEIVGYFFLRCFFVGRAFHGLFVNPEHKGHGIGTEMWRLSSLICRDAGLKMCATVADDNVASLTSLRRGCRVDEEVPISNGYHMYRLSALRR